MDRKAAIVAVALACLVATAAAAVAADPVKKANLAPDNNHGDRGSASGQLIVIFNARSFEGPNANIRSVDIETGALTNLGKIQNYTVSQTGVIGYDADAGVIYLPGQNATQDGVKPYVGTVVGVDASSPGTVVSSHLTGIMPFTAYFHASNPHGVLTAGLTGAVDSGELLGLCDFDSGDWSKEASIGDADLLYSYWEDLVFTVQLAAGTNNVSITTVNVANQYQQTTVVTDIVCEGSRSEPQWIVATSEVDAYVLNIDGPNPGLNLYHVDVTTGESTLLVTLANGLVMSSIFSAYDPDHSVIYFSQDVLGPSAFLGYTVSPTTATLTANVTIAGDYSLLGYVPSAVFEASRF